MALSHSEEIPCMVGNDPITADGDNGSCPVSGNTNNADSPPRCASESSILSESDEQSGEKYNSDTTIAKGNLFKKPVFVGPRKGKSTIKLKVCRNDDERDLSSEIQHNNIESKEETSCDNSIISVMQADKEVQVKRVPKISPAQKLNENFIPIPYKEPKWSGVPDINYSFEVLKNGGIIETIDLSSKSYFVFGRLVNCDVYMAHPTVSRYHAVLQYRKDSVDGDIGFYIYDLGSTHGTFLNKNRIKPNLYVRVHVGHLLKFGGSSRMFILQGPTDDMEQESEMSVTELKEKYREEKLLRELQELKEVQEQQLKEEKEKNDGIDWGMGEDAEEETDLSENPFAAAPNEELYLEDPKKTLRGWFEREGHDLEYNVEEKGFGQFLCRIELPVENAKGGIIIAEALVKGKKKEAVVQCALEACRILDRYGLLRQAKHESRKRKAKNWEENDFYDSDEDEFLDRTGAVEKKRHQRMKAAGKIETQTDTYETLVKKYEDLKAKIESIESELPGLINSNRKEPVIAEDEDELDAFMSNLSSEVPDNKLISKLKNELSSLRKEEVHLKKLVNIACPASLPKLMDNPKTITSSSVHLKNRIQIGFHKSKSSTSCEGKLSVPALMSDEVKNSTEDEQEIEEEEDEEEKRDELIAEDKRVNIFKDRTEAADSEIGVKNTCVQGNGTAVQESNVSPAISVSVQSGERLPVISHSDNDESNGEIVKKTKVIGPSLPEDFVAAGATEKRKKKLRQRTQRKSLKQNENALSSDPNYSMWVPPEGQTGDGKTKLNDKYGY